MKNFFIFCAFFLTHTAFAQVGLNLTSHLDAAEIPDFSPAVKLSNIQNAAATSVLNLPETPPPFLQKYYNYNDLAFFCKVEVQLEKAVTFPVKFRLGSVDYVDMLEGK